MFWGALIADVVTLLMRLVMSPMVSHKSQFTNKLASVMKQKTQTNQPEGQDARVKS